MSAYILSGIFAAMMIVVTALISSAIRYEGGANPKDPTKRKMWFWILAIGTPLIFYILAAGVIAPSSKRALQDWIDSLPLATVLSFLLYVIFGFALSKVLKNGKISNWF